MKPFQKKVGYLIAGVVFSKLLLSAVLQLGNDEVYYLTYAQQLQWNYFDHPPLTALVIKCFSANLLLRHEVFLRSGFIAIGGMQIWLMFMIGRKLGDAYTGWIAALLFTASVYGSMISGFMIMPDAPLLLFWLSGILLVLHLDACTERRRRHGLWLLFGLAGGLAVMSKVSGVLLWAGLGCYMLCCRSAWFKEPGMYLSLLVTAVIAAPIVFWNLNNGGAGIGYHADRVAIHHFPVRADRFLREVLGEMAYNNPICYILGFAGAVCCCKNRLLPRKRLLLLFCFIAPLLLLVWFFSWFREVLPHWTGPSCVLLSFFGAVYIAHRYREKVLWPRVVKWAGALTVAGVLLITAASFFLPVAFHPKEALRTGKGDLTLDFTGWKAFARHFDAVYRRDIARGVMKPSAFILSDYWFPAAHMNWYLSGKYHYPFMAIGPLRDIHQFAWLNRQRPGLKAGADAYYITVSNYYRKPGDRLIRSFDRVEGTETIPQVRMGQVVRYFYITRLRHYKDGIGPSGVTD
ncbi:ArnT family glycosyltransferase [Niabella aurantiaca]|uniref:ArnT family glycosyltransferase n=1 Tax=Niabella aurantiaca TaxID=379900 RepID=UPI00035FC36D|nr:glycosyltransferase family 39 protein [Niabella aurantiaca]